MMTMAIEGNQSMLLESNGVDMEIEETGGYKELNNRYFIAPRLFVVAADGSAGELLCEEQLKYATRAKAVMGDLAFHEQTGDFINNQHIDLKVAK
jgi:hypothetical protein